MRSSTSHKVARRATTESGQSSRSRSDSLNSLTDKSIDQRLGSVQRIVRLVAAQQTLGAMVSVLEPQLRNLVGADQVRVLLVRNGDRFVHPTLPNGVQPVSVGGLAALSLERKQIINLSEPDTDPRWVPKIDDSTSMCTAYACVPIKFDPRVDCRGSRGVVAVIQVYRFGADSVGFTYPQCSLLFHVGGFVGNILRGCQDRLIQQEEKASQDLSSLTHARALSSLVQSMTSELRLKVIIPKILKKVLEILDAEHGFLFLVDRENLELVLRKGNSLGPPRNFSTWVFGESSVHAQLFQSSETLHFPINEGLAGFVARTGEAVRVVNARMDERFSPAMDQLSGIHTERVLTVPVLDGNRVPIGVLQALNKNPLYDGFSATDEALMTMCAAQTAVAVLNAQLHEKMKDALTRSSALREVTLALSAELNISALLSLVIRKAQKLLKCERCTVFMTETNSAGEKVLMTSARMTVGLGEEQINSSKDKQQYIALGQGIVGTVAKTGHLISAANAKKHSAYDEKVDKYGQEQPRSLLCVPIADRKGGIVGVILATNKLRKYASSFARSDERLLAAFCAQAAMAIGNSRLLQQTESALNRALAGQRNLKFMQSIQMNMFRDLQLGSLTERLAKQARQLLDADACTLYLANATTRKLWVAADTTRDKQAGDVPVAGDGGGGGGGGGERHHSFSVGLAGMAADTQTLICIPENAADDPRFDPKVDGKVAPVAHMVCPILRVDNVVDDDDDEEGKGSGDGAVGYISGETTGMEAPHTVLVTSNGGTANTLVAPPTKTVTLLGLCAVSMHGGEREEGWQQQPLWGEAQEELLRMFCAQAAKAITRSQELAKLMEKSSLDSERMQEQEAAALYLKEAQGMRLASNDIHGFAFTMDEVELQALIGNGMYGEVFRAVLQNRVVAVKKLKVGRLTAQQIDAFCNEAGLMCQLRHPNVVGFIGAVPEPSNLCIITEYCARGSLTDVILEPLVELSLERKISFCLDAAQGMLYLHSSNPVILHRDLKSDNLLVTDDWRIKVSDFGLTRFKNERISRTTQVGTPMWMAPEVIRGRQFTQKSDVYAFGIIMWEIIVRAEPYGHLDPMQVVVKVVNEDKRPRITPELRSSPLMPLIQACWDRDPARRPTFNLVVKALRVVLDSVQRKARFANSSNRPI